MLAQQSETAPVAQAGSLPARSNPQQVYEARRQHLLREFDAFDHKDRNIATARGIVFLVGLAIAYFSLVSGVVAPIWLCAPPVIFVGLAISHHSIIKQKEHLRRAIGYYDRGLERLADRWSGVGVSGQRYENHSHPYSSDLDIFGEGSLFQLLCGSRTRLGEDTLAGWLSAPAELAAVRQRHEAIGELLDKQMFRENLAVLDAEVHDELDQNKLREWVREPAHPFSQRQRTTATILGVLAASSLLYWAMGGLISVFLVVLVIELLFYARLIQNIRHIARGAEDAGSGLAILGQVLELLEREQFTSPNMKRLRALLDVEGHPPSWQINKLRNQIQNLSACLQNQFFAPIAFVLGVPVHIAHHVEMWREQVGPHIPDWLAAVGEIEALSSLSGYAFEHPQDIFPVLTDESEGSCFEAVELGHPLISGGKCIRNDVHIHRDLPLLMVSGSNMSGKSTLLRTIGISAVLAWCGAPVRASQLRISRVQVGTEMRIHDSLQQGVSLFYTAISRLKTVVELASKTPTLLFLLDEILQGTNSHDRRVGAEGIIRQLIERGAFGLVTTHDLALTRIVEAFHGGASNIHFEDHLINGKMYFDHRIRTGVVRKSNALELMRMIGLEVVDDGLPFDGE